jgi:hypothetical protein
MPPSTRSTANDWDVTHAERARAPARAALAELRAARAAGTRDVASAPSPPPPASSPPSPPAGTKRPRVLESESEGEEANDIALAAAEAAAAAANGDAAAAGDVLPPWSDDEDDEDEEDEDDANFIVADDDDDDAGDDGGGADVSAYARVNHLVDAPQAPVVVRHVSATACCGQRYALALESFLANVRAYAPAALETFDFGSVEPRPVHSNEFLAKDAHGVRAHPCPHIELLATIADAFVPPVPTLYATDEWARYDEYLRADIEKRATLVDVTRSHACIDSARALVGAGADVVMAAAAGARRATGNPLVDGTLVRMLEATCTRRQMGGGARERYAELRIDSGRSALLTRLVLACAATLVPFSDEMTTSGRAAARAEAAFVYAAYPRASELGRRQVTLLPEHIGGDEAERVTLVTLLSALTCDWCQEWRASTSYTGDMAWLGACVYVPHDADGLSAGDARTLTTIDERVRSSPFARGIAYDDDAYVTRACTRCVRAIRSAVDLVACVRTLADAPPLDAVAGLPAVYADAAAAALGAYVKVHLGADPWAVLNAQAEALAAQAEARGDVPVVRRPPKRAPRRRRIEADDDGDDDDDDDDDYDDDDDDV